MSESLSTKAGEVAGDEQPWSEFDIDKVGGKSYVVHDMAQMDAPPDYEVGSSVSMIVVQDGLKKLDKFKVHKTWRDPKTNKCKKWQQRAVVFVDDCADCYFPTGSFQLSQDGNLYHDQKKNTWFKFKDLRAA
ncbi:MAG: hypothetical protein Q9159_002116 [Coniocarpon cinnabarinum]